MNLCQLSVGTSILVSFVEAVSGSPASAVVFWILLFSAAVANAPEREESAEFHRRWM
jgi:hypothetical protein